MPELWYHGIHFSEPRTVSIRLLVGHAGPTMMVGQESYTLDITNVPSGNLERLIDTLCRPMTPELFTGVLISEGVVVVEGLIPPFNFVLVTMPCFSCRVDDGWGPRDKTWTALHDDHPHLFVPMVVALQDGNQLVRMLFEFEHPFASELIALSFDRRDPPAARLYQELLRAPIIAIEADMGRVGYPAWPVVAQRRRHMRGLDVLQPVLAEVYELLGHSPPEEAPLPVRVESDPPPATGLLPEPPMRSWPVQPRPALMTRLARILADGFWRGLRALVWFWLRVTGRWPLQVGLDLDGVLDESVYARFELYLKAHLNTPVAQGLRGDGLSTPGGDIGEFLGTSDEHVLELWHQMLIEEAAAGLGHVTSWAERLSLRRIWLFGRLYVVTRRDPRFRLDVHQMLDQAYDGMIEPYDMLFSHGNVVTKDLILDALHMDILVDDQPNYLHVITGHFAILFGRYQWTESGAESVLRYNWAFRARSWREVLTRSQRRIIWRTGRYDPRKDPSSPLYMAPSGDESCPDKA